MRCTIAGMLLVVFLPGLMSGGKPSASILAFSPSFLKTSAGCAQARSSTSFLGRCSPVVPTTSLRAFSRDELSSSLSQDTAQSSTSVVTPTSAILGAASGLSSMFAPSNWLPRILLDDAESEEEKQELELLRSKYNLDAIGDWGARRPVAISNRLFALGQAFFRVKQVWEKEESIPAEKRTRGALLRAELAKLGPVAVKVGQTLSQRPDMIAEDVCEALKGLQTANSPFPNALAMAVIADELQWKGPIAPGLPLPPGCTSQDKTLFAAMSAEPIASASLGQVYRGTTHEGMEVAIKVQRPGALRQCIIDCAVFIGAFKRIQGLWGNGDLMKILDVVAGGIMQELDFRNEARNAAAFAKSLAYLGYVTVPKTVSKYSIGPQVMVLEWVHGRHLSDLNKDEQVRMCTMATEAVTAGLLLTGIVHADPHEGNLMLDNQGRLVFLDFGLMSTVETEMMEAFAYGIQAVLNKDWPALTDAFVATGFFGTPIMYRETTSSPWVGGSKEEVTKELAMRMQAADGGLSRFGALSTVLFDMSDRWEEFTPPYIILLIRTFLTLEGMANKVDPNFNIYEAALPWAIQRGISPSTAAGATALRGTLLTPDNKLQWQRLEELIEQAAPPPPTSEAPDGTATDGTATDDGRGSSRAQSRRQGSVSAVDSVTTVMGSRSGGALRRILRDLDSPALLLKLNGGSSRKLRRLAVDAVAALFIRQSSEADRVAAAWPLSQVAAAIRQRRLARVSAVVNVLIRSHAQRLVSGGWQGLAAMAALVCLTVRIGVGALLVGLVAKLKGKRT